MRFLTGEQGLGEFGAAGEAVREIKGFGDHDAGVAVGPIGGRGTLEGNADTKLKGRKIAGGCAVVVGIADDENLAGEDAGLGNGAGIGEIGFGLENGEDDGVALDEDFLGVVPVEELFYGFMQVETEVRRRT